MPKFPNILLIIIDSARYDKMSCFGYQRETTPFIDNFIKEGIVFDLALTQAPWTLPSHATIFTGLYPTEHGLMRGNKSNNIELPENIQTIAQLLNSKDYRTAGFSSNPWVGGTSKLDRGFDVFIESNLKVVNKSDVIKLRFIVKLFNKIFPSSHLLSKILPYIIKRPILTKILRSIIEDWIEQIQKSSHPFFVFANFMDTHPPYNPGKKNLKQVCDGNIPKISSTKLNLELRKYTGGQNQFDDKIINYINDYYDASLYNVDQELGKLIGFLKKKDILDDTCIIITSDHGKTLGEYDRNNVMHYMKDSNLRVPLIIRYPKKYPLNKTIKDPVGLIDLFYLMLNLAGLNQNPNLENHKRGLSSLLSSRNNKYTYSEALLPFIKETDDLDYVQTIRTGNFKYINSRNQGEFLFNIKKDPKERENILEENLNAYLKHKDLLREHLASIELAEKKSSSEQTVEDLDEDIKERLKVLGYLD